MNLKHFINKVKDEHKKFKEKKQTQNPAAPVKAPVNNYIPPDQFNSNEKNQKGVSLVDNIFDKEMEQALQEEVITRDYRVKKGDTLQTIAEFYYGDSAYWIMIHRYNIEKLPNPENIYEGLILHIPNHGDIENEYPLISQEGNYIIQPDDTLFTISAKVFGRREFSQRLLDWNFLKYKKDIYPGKEITGLKYLDLESQLDLLAKKYEIPVNDFNNILAEQKNILLSVIAETARKFSVPPVIAMAVSDTENHWMNHQYNKEGVRLSENWKPMLINENIYKDLFPVVAMSLEENIFYGIQLLKTLRSETTNWPKAIVNYNLSSPPGKGRPDEQKQKAQQGIYFLNGILSRLEKEDNKELIKTKLLEHDKNDITYELLYKELKDYKDFLSNKYLR